MSAIKVFFALLFIIMLSPAPSFSMTGGRQELNRDNSRKIAEDFVRAQPDFLTNNGRDLTVIAEEPLRCERCWAFDFKYIFIYNGIPHEKYITVTVQDGKASRAVPVEERSPEKQ